MGKLSESVSSRIPVLEGCVLCGRYDAGSTWSGNGLGRIWVESQGSGRAIDSARTGLRDVTAWADEQWGIRPVVQSVDVAADDADRVVYSASDFFTFVSRIALNQPNWTLSAEFALYARLQRFALEMALSGDTVAFAGPAHLGWPDVFRACLKLGRAQEEPWTPWTAHTEAYQALWLPAWTDTRQLALRQRYVSEADRCFDAGWQRGSGWLKRDHGRLLVDIWLAVCVDRYTRSSLFDGPQPVDLVSPRRSSYQILYRGEAEMQDKWRKSLWTENADRPFEADGWLVWRLLRQAFEATGWQEERLLDRTGKLNYHLDLELLPPLADHAQTHWALRYGIAHNVWDAHAMLHEWWQMPERRWTVDGDVLIGPDTWILPALGAAGAICPAIARSLQDSAPAQAVVQPDEVYELIMEQLPALRAQGCTVRAPAFDTAGSKDIRIKVQVKRSRVKSAGNWNRRSGGWFDLHQLVDFDWMIVVDGEELSRDEFEAMVERQTPYVQIAGSWRLLPVQTILEQIHAIGSGGKSTASIQQLSRLVLGQEEDVEMGDVAIDVSYDEGAADVHSMMDILAQAHEPAPVATPIAFRGTLRRYQALGLAWLVHLRSIGCGGCLADDMGLGKTIQVLAYLLYLKEQGLTQGTHLLLCPTSLLHNWKAEIARFAPDLRVYLHHGGLRNQPSAEGVTPLAQAITAHDIIITTYATAVRDADELNGMGWDVVIADEAQSIKNAETKQARAVRKLPALHRIALTGTPIENRLEELWSIFQFTNPGYLGTLAWFRKVFAGPIASHPNAPAAHRLHVLLRPVLLRRRKTEPAIQLELPDKWEVREHAALSPEQAALYQSVVNRLFSGMAQMSGDGGVNEGRVRMQRRGQILAALVRLKQICDHPCLVAGGGTDVRRSSKLQLLLDLLEDVVDEGDSALVFTQFRDMGELLCGAIAERFGWTPKFLHGGLHQSARGQIVDDFQSGRDKAQVLVLSLKAGGVGLNLTRANHVFHFDRWWNPAVEDQATDRAFRIGQSKDVQVHKFVCSGTVEERIDSLITAKRQLSAAVVGESEGWLTDFDDAALRELLALDDGAVEEDDV